MGKSPHIHLFSSLMVPEVITPYTVSALMVSDLINPCTVSRSLEECTCNSYIFHCDKYNPTPSYNLHNLSNLSYSPLLVNLHIFSCAILSIISAIFLLFFVAQYHRYSCYNSQLYCYCNNFVLRYSMLSLHSVLQ